jgi:hypothetical protein
MKLSATEYKEPQLPSSIFYDEARLVSPALGLHSQQRKVARIASPFTARCLNFLLTYYVAIGPRLVAVAFQRAWSIRPVTATRMMCRSLSFRPSRTGAMIRMCSLPSW